MKYYGTVGYAVTKPSDDDPDIYANVIEEHTYYGDVMGYPSQRWQQSDKVNDDLGITNKLSILADPFAFANFQHIKFVTWMGQRWKVTNIEIEYPRMILTLGGEWNGETAEGTE